MILTIGNNKGGTGKTTIAVHLAIALSKLGKKVLLIDNDSQCNASRVITKKSKEGSNSLNDLLDPETIDEPCKLSDYSVPTQFEGLSFISNVIDASRLNLFFAQNFPESLFYIRSKIREQAMEKFDFTLIDCPPTLDTPFGQALCASDAVIVPVEVGSIYSLDGLDSVLDIIEAMRSHNPELAFLKLIMNRADMRTVISKAMIAQIKDNYQDMYFETILPVCTAMQQAQFCRETLFTHAPTSSTIPKYKQFAKELLKAVSNDSH